MLLLVRVDDRLLHGQVLGAWVPSLGVELLIVASDEVRADAFRTAVMEACSDQGLRVEVASVDDVAGSLKNGKYKDVRAALVVGELQDALRLHDMGLVFESVNIGNIHHSTDGARNITRSVTLDSKDDEILESFLSRGVRIDIRDIPSREPVSYKIRSAKEA
jgi:PTS system mannose-specific IIB component